MRRRRGASENSPISAPETAEIARERVASSRMPSRPLISQVAVAIVALAGATAAAGSIDVTVKGSQPALKVDARGAAEVSWTEGGVRKTLLVPPSGRYLPGGRILSADVSSPAPKTGIVGAVVVRKTPDGRLWALQRTPTQPDGSTTLRLARWQGDPTELEASLEGERITGKATFAGRGVFGTSPTTAGTAVTHFAWVDCWRCSGARGWKRLLGVRLRGPGGTFALALRPAWRAQRYRVTVLGPNRGADYAPDAVVVVAR